jgi:hypothetical protein
MQSDTIALFASAARNVPFSKKNVSRIRLKITIEPRSAIDKRNGSADEGSQPVTTKPIAQKTSKSNVRSVTSVPKTRHASQCSCFVNATARKTSPSLSGATLLMLKLTKKTRSTTARLGDGEATRLSISHQRIPRTLKPTRATPMAAAMKRAPTRSILANTANVLTRVASR